MKAHPHWIEPMLTVSSLFDLASTGQKDELESALIEQDKPDDREDHPPDNGEMSLTVNHGWSSVRWPVSHHVSVPLVRVRRSGVRVREVWHSI